MKVKVEPAARAGHLECVQYLIERGLPITEELWECAAEGNQLSTLKYIIAPYKEQFCWFSLHMVWGPAVCSSSSIDCVEYLLETFPTLFSYEHIASKACAAENVYMLKYALERSSMPVAKVVRSAARAGSMKCLLYLQDEWNANCWIPSTVVEAAHQGHLELMLELLQRGCPCDKVYMLHFVNELLSIMEGNAQKISEGVFSQYMLEKMEVLKQARTILVHI